MIMNKILKILLLLCLLAGIAHPAQAEDELRSQLRLLSSRDEAVRIEAGNWIAAHGREHMQELIDLLPDHDSEISYGAALSLGLMGPAAGAALPDLIDQLTNPDITDVVVDSIMNITDQWPDIFSQLAHSKVAFVRSVGARAFGLCQRSNVAIPELVVLLGDADQSVVLAACQALLWYPSDAAPAVPALRRLLAHENALLRESAVTSLELLAKHAGRDTAQALRPLLGDSEPRVRSAAINALVKISPKDYTLVGSLADMLEDDEAVVRVNAAFALSHFGKHAAPAVGKLTETLGRKLWYLAPFGSEMATNNIWAPLIALGSIGPEAKAALPEIRKLLEDPYHALDAAEAIYRISKDGTALIGLLEAELESRDPRRIIEALGIARSMQKDARELLPDISRLLLSDEAVVRQASVEVMAVIADDPAMAAGMYAKLLSGATADERLLLLNRLRDFGSAAKNALDDIYPLLKGTDDFELALAASTIYTISGEVLPSRDVLMDVISRDNSDAISVAAHGLRLMGVFATDALPRLRQIAADQVFSDSARNAASRAIEEIEKSGI
jgi:HEAT repeat protein